MARKSTYKPEYGAMLIAHMRKGHTLESFAGSIGVTRPTLYNWAKQYPEFKEAKEKGEAAAVFFWEQIGKDLILGKLKKAGSNVWMLNYRNYLRKQWQIEVQEALSLFKRRDTLPKTTTSPKAGYKPEYGDQLLEHRYQGGTLFSFAGRIGVSWPTLMSWVEHYPEFKEAKEIAYCGAFWYWEEIGLRGMMGKIRGFNAGVWVLFMTHLWDSCIEKALEAAEERVRVIFYDAENPSPPTNLSKVS